MTDMKHSIMKNPLMILLLGATPALAATTDVRSALGMGGAVLVILVLSNIITFLLKDKIAHETKLATNILIVTGVVSVVQMLMAAFLPSIYNMLGLYVAIVAVTALTSRQADLADEAQSVGEAAKYAVSAGLTLLAVMVVVAVIRELLGSASIAGMDIAFLANYKISALAKAPGAYIVLAMVAACVSKMGMGKEKEDK
ncbi:MAG: hypothetical protein IKT25_01765 [Firmicutes bacterium]|nr:hypothetical protein [Bacillota bacterium]MBR6500221.1 hypothetical protein [Bacillota bacterium]